MNKLINTMALFLLSVMAFAQDFGPEDDPTEYAPGNPPLTPIDNYTIALITLAVFIIAFVVYKRRQSKIA